MRQARREQIIARIWEYIEQSETGETYDDTVLLLADIGMDCCIDGHYTNGDGDE